MLGSSAYDSPRSGSATPRTIGRGARAQWDAEDAAEEDVVFVVDVGDDDGHGRGGGRRRPHVLAAEEDAAGEGAAVTEETSKMAEFSKSTPQKDESEQALAAAKAPGDRPEGGAQHDCYPHIVQGLRVAASRSAFPCDAPARASRPSGVTASTRDARLGSAPPSDRGRPHFPAARQFMRVSVCARVERAASEMRRPRPAHIHQAWRSTDVGAGPGTPGRRRRSAVVAEMVSPTRNATPSAHSSRSRACRHALDEDLDPDIMLVCGIYGRAVSERPHRTKLEGDR